IVIPDGVPAAAAEAARETLAGAVTAADALPPELGRLLQDAAAHAFDTGVGMIAVIGAALVVIAGVIAATTLGSGARSTKRVETEASQPVQAPAGSDRH